MHRFSATGFYFCNFSNGTPCKLSFLPVTMYNCTSRDWQLKNETGILKLELITIISFHISGFLIAMYKNDSRPFLAAFWTFILRSSNILITIFSSRSFENFLPKIMMQKESYLDLSLLFHIYWSKITLFWSF